MADVKFSEFPEAEVPLLGDEYVVGLQQRSTESGESNVKYTVDDIATYVFTQNSQLVTAADLQGTGLDVDAAGFRGVPQNAQTGNYTTVAADAGKHLYHASGAGAGDTYTIDSNANVAYEIGTAITFVNLSADTVAIAITSDTMYLAGTGTTGTRTLAQYGIATALKTGATEWLISGTGLT